MASKKTIARGSKQKPRRRTYRNKMFRGGLRPEMKQMIDEAVFNPTIVNPDSKFVVFTYWWGRGVVNKNTQIPCLDEIEGKLKNVIKKLVQSPEGSVLPEFANVVNPLKAYNAAYDRYEAVQATGDPEALKQEDKSVRAAKQIWDDSYTAYLRTPDGLARKKKFIDESIEFAVGTNTGRAGITFEKMIENWEKRCKDMNCNYMSVECKIPAGMVGYQYAINAKGYAIKKALEKCGGRGILYIDGDMFVNKYPILFDIPDVDFMARNWGLDPREGVDPRSGQLYPTNCYDPYVFETSGGTMFFGNTPTGNKLLDEWIKEESLASREGKADDRILSWVVNRDNWLFRANVIELPVEYLWLTDKYKAYPIIETLLGGKCGPVIEHPACLTSEESALGTLSSAVNSRTLAEEEELIQKSVVCNRDTGIFYEYIFFPSQESADAMKPFLTFMNMTVNAETGKPLLEVVKFADKYGTNSSVAAQNETSMASANITADTTGQVVKLPQTATIHEILACLALQKNVQVGDDSSPLAEPTDIRYTDIASPDAKGLPRSVKIDPNSPIYFGWRNPVVTHLLKMCSTLSDINTHVQKSYMFCTRIRWSNQQSITPQPFNPVPTSEELVPPTLQPPAA